MIVHSSLSFRAVTLRYAEGTGGAEKHPEKHETKGGQEPSTLANRATIRGKKARLHPHFEI